MTEETKVRIKIAAVALTWVGTPFYPHQAIKGVGVDCVQLALAIYKEAGIIPSTIELPKDYFLAGGDHLDTSLVLKWLEVSPWFEPDDCAGLGDVVTLRVGRVDHHVGVVTGEHTFVQAIRSYGVREFDLRDTTWATRLRTFWKPKV